MDQSGNRHAALATSAEPNHPAITAIVITRNKESHIRECITALMEQSVADRLEIVVVDQGSEQSEPAIIADLQRRHKNLISVRISSGEGGYSGVDLAVKIASGRYLTVLDAADRMAADAYRLLSQALEENRETLLVYGDTCLTAIPHQSFISHTSYGKMIWPDYTPEQLAQLPEVAPHPMWRRELSDRTGGLGKSDEALRDLILAAANSSAVLHLQALTGLKLIPVTTRQHSEKAAIHPPIQATATAQARAAAPSPAGSIAPSPIGVTAPSPTPAPAFHAGDPDADEAFALIKPLLRGDDHSKAAEALDSHLEKYPRHAVAHNDLGAISYKMGAKDKALKHYRLAVELNPEDTIYQKNLADMLYVEEGEIDEAIAIYLKLLEKSPRDVETLLNLGIISEGVGQQEEAESFYQRALEIEPWNPAVRERLMELRNRESEEALADDDEEPVEERYQRVQALVDEGDLEQATRELERILEAYPDFPPAHNDLAVLYHQEGDKERALAHYEKAAALVPGNSTYQKNLADFYFVEGHDIDGAIAIYLDQLKKEPKNTDTLMNLGKICTLLDRPEEAKTFYGKVTQLEPWNEAARECLTNLRRCANG